jgi:hypothetical protein
MLMAFCEREAASGNHAADFRSANRNRDPAT